MLEFSTITYRYRALHKLANNKREERVKVLVCALRLFVAALWLFSLPAKAELNGCDEGVIRLPDRNGTIQICSSLAAKVPLLSRQLTEMSKSYQSQQQQIAELTRLVRGLNNIGRGLDAERQGRMLESLSAELGKGQSAGVKTTKEIFESLSTRLEELQSRMLSALSNPAGTAAMNEALKSTLGDAIAKLDLGQANRQLADIAEQIKTLQAGVSEIKSDTIAIRASLSSISAEIKALNARGGLVENPKNYAELYHNARALAQRGEVDLALASYLKVLEDRIQLADPIIDLTTLLTRMYGKEGAEKYIEKNIKKSTSRPVYIYARQLLAPKQLTEAYQLMLNHRQEFLSFPPLGALYLRKIEGKESLDAEKFPWSDWIMLFSVISSVQSTIESGDYLSYFADQIRGGSDIDGFEQTKKFFDYDKILVKFLPNHSGEKFQYMRRAIDIRTSPIGLDFTYYLETPDRMKIGGSWFSIPMGREYMNKPFDRGIERFDILIWDVAIDRKKPIEICARQGDAEKCLDFNVVERICKVSMNEEGKNCLRSRPDSGTYSAAARIHINPEEMLGQKCLSKISYTDEDGRKVNTTSRSLIATFRGPGSEKLLGVMKACGYAIQVDQEVKMRQYF